MKFQCQWRKRIRIHIQIKYIQKINTDENQQWKKTDENKMANKKKSLKVECCWCLNVRVFLLLFEFLQLFKQVEEDAIFWALKENAHTWHTYAKGDTLQSSFYPYFHLLCAIILECYFLFAYAYMHRISIHLVHSLSSHSISISRGTWC